MFYSGGWHRNADQNCGLGWTYHVGPLDVQRESATTLNQVSCAITNSIKFQCKASDASNGTLRSTLNCSDALSFAYPIYLFKCPAYLRLVIAMFSSHNMKLSGTKVVSFRGPWYHGKFLFGLQFSRMVDVKMIKKSCFRHSWPGLQVSLGGTK